MSIYTKALNKIQDGRGKKSPEEVPADAKEQIPAFDPDREIELRAASWERGVRIVRNTTPDKRIVIDHFPNSVIAEQYRSLRTNLKARLAEEGAKVILISSSLIGEGKTVTAVNLAYTLAEIPTVRVALVDADLRRGKIASYLTLGKDLPGLSEYLQIPEMTVKEAAVRTSLENLLVIPRGALVKNPSELVSSEKFRNLVGELKRHFDYVIIDGPPIMSVSDSAIFGREADGLVMVIQSGKTPKTVIAHAHQLFKQAGIKLLGYVLTNVEFQSADYKYYQYNYYGEHEQPKGIKGWFKTAKDHSTFHIKRVGSRLERAENRLTHWWERRRRKNGGKQDAASKAQGLRPQTADNGQKSL